MIEWKLMLFIRPIKTLLTATVLSPHDSVFILLIKINVATGPMIFSWLGFHYSCTVEKSVTPTFYPNAVTPVTPCLRTPFTCPDLIWITCLYMTWASQRCNDKWLVGNKYDRDWNLRSTDEITAMNQVKIIIGGGGIACAVSCSAGGYVVGMSLGQILFFSGGFF